jgi:hypothetical protein
MFREGSTDRWQWSADLHEGINFCAWVLLQDGLRVPPFDRHPPGDGRLQAAGLEADAWRSWLTAVHGGDGPLRSTQLGWARPPQELGDEPYSPTVHWPAESAVGRRIRELWTSYRPHGNEWKRSGASRALHLDARLGLDLWHALEPLHDRLPTLRVYVTEYPEPVSYLMPPVSVILGTNQGSVDQATYAAGVLRAAQELARRE